MKAQKGAALILVLAAVILIMIAIAALLRSLGNISSLKYSHVRDLQARYAAEAGIQTALWHCRQAGGVCPGSVNGTIQGIPFAVATASSGGNFYTLVAKVDVPDS